MHGAKDRRFKRVPKNIEASFSYGEVIKLIACQTILIFCSSGGRSMLSKRGNRTGKALPSFVITDWSFSPMSKKNQT